MKHLARSTYDQLLARLEDEALYTAGGIAELAEQIGMVAADQPTRDQEKRSIRQAMANRTQNHGFPLVGDGRLGQEPAWLGKRWKQAPALKKKRWKHNDFSWIGGLYPDALYSPATLVMEFCAGRDHEWKQRRRVALGRVAEANGFPEEGDGLIERENMAPLIGWTGERWLRALNG